MTTFIFSMPETQKTLSESNVKSEESNLNKNIQNQELESKTIETIDIIKNKNKDQMEETYDKIKNNILSPQEPIKNLVTNNRLIVVSLIGLFFFIIIVLLLWYKLKSNQPLN